VIVRCETCHSQFSLDEHGLGPDGSDVRCSVCASVFHVAAPQPWNFDQQAWQIRTRAGDRYVVRDFKVLRRWLVEGRVNPEDEISRTGRQWTALAEMPELTPYWPSDRLQADPATSGVLKATGQEWSIYQQAQHAHARTQTPTFRPPADAPVAAGTGSAWSASAAFSPPSENEGVELGAMTSGTGQARANLAEDMRLPMASIQAFEASRNLDLDLDLEAPELRVTPKRSKTWLWLTGVAAAGIGAWLGLASQRAGENIAIEGKAPAPAAIVPEQIEPPPASPNKDNLEHRLENLAREVATCDELRIESALQGLRELGAASDRSPVRTQARALTAQTLAMRALLWRLGSFVEKDAASKEATTSEQRDRAEFVRSYVLVDQDRPDPSELHRVNVFGDLLLEKEPTYPVADELKPLLVFSELASQSRNLGALVSRVPARSEGSDPLASSLQTALHYALADAAGEDVEAWLRAQSENHIVARSLRKARLARLAAKESERVVAPNAGAAATPSTPVVAQHESLVEKGCSLVGRGDASGGLAILLKAFDTTPDDPEVLLCMGQAHARLSQHARALALFEKVLSRSSSHRVGLYGAATSSAAQGDMVRANRYFSRLLVVDPTNASARAFMEAHAPKKGELPNVTSDRP
jgi:predicted Zn finger-like uncharacterized protein